MEALNKSRVFIVVGLGFGDEGKGTTTHWLASRHKARAVVRTGGPQAFHRVVTSGGAEHVFSQFGSGTLCGATTHLSRNMVIDPDAILNEARALRYEHGIGNILDYLTIHRDALVITPFQAIANRVRELARGPNRLGTVGIGVGETVLDAEALGDSAIRARDLGAADLADRLAGIQARKLREMEEVIGLSENLSGPAGERARGEMEKLADPETVRWAVERFNRVASSVRIVDTTYLADEILGRPGSVVFEGSQGLLLDPGHGFHPHTTKVRTAPAAAFSLLEECGHDGDARLLGVIRGYHTRHGAGPFVTESPELAERLPDPFNRDHPWQGGFRVGPLDLVALRYAIAACGGAAAFHGLVATCLDRVHGLGSWRFCDTYVDASGVTVDEIGGPERITEYLSGCRPQFKQHKVPSGEAAEGFALRCAGFLGETIGVPVRVVSIGPTEMDKIEL